uniref:Uncharacterized protein n=1 Tax=Daphnia galeata TaxID=27404 RepID=A0A8J2S625_9CRUS|nr:unnamed protein product [Daphnia galeata]
MWESSDWMLIQSQSRRVLPATSIKLGLGLTILNAVLWLIAMILQAFLLFNIDYYVAPSSYMLVCICLGWSATILFTTAGSLYGLIRNREKDVKSYLILTTSTAVFSLFIFLAFLITLCLDTATESWQGPGGFSIFTGLYVFGESCIIIWYFTNQWKAFKNEMEEERFDRIQQRVREQQHHHLDVLTHSAQQAPPNEYQVEQVMETFENEEVAQERNKVEETSDSDSDRLTYLIVLSNHKRKREKKVTDYKVNWTGVGTLTNSLRDELAVSRYCNLPDSGAVSHYQNSGGRTIALLCLAAGSVFTSLALVTLALLSLTSTDQGTSYFSLCMTSNAILTVVGFIGCSISIALITISAIASSSHKRFQSAPNELEEVKKVSIDVSASQQSTDSSEKDIINSQPKVAESTGSTNSDDIYESLKSQQGSSAAENGALDSSTIVDQIIEPIYAIPIKKKTMSSSNLSSAGDFEIEVDNRRDSEVKEKKITSTKWFHMEAPEEPLGSDVDDSQYSRNIELPKEDVIVHAPSN